MRGGAQVVVVVVAADTVVIIAQARQLTCLHFTEVGQCCAILLTQPKPLAHGLEMPSRMSASDQQPATCTSGLVNPKCDPSASVFVCLPQHRD